MISISRDSSNHSKANQSRGFTKRPLDWFLRFSQFYGNYKGQALKDRHRWVQELKQAQGSHLQ